MTYQKDAISVLTQVRKKYKEGALKWIDEELFLFQIGDKEIESSDIAFLYHREFKGVAGGSLEGVVILEMMGRGFNISRSRMVALCVNHLIRKRSKCVSMLELEDTHGYEGTMEFLGEVVNDYPENPEKYDDK